MLRDLARDKLLLASGSPRRQQLLAEAGFEPIVHAVALSEERRRGEQPLAMAERLARQKAVTAGRETTAGWVVLGADTIVVDDGRVLGKPAGPAEARNMLWDLQGREHEVVTALALIERATGREVRLTGRTTLGLRPLAREEIGAYVEAGGPLDKAGAYGIQDEAFQPVEMDSFVGCFTNVMGLPLCLLDRGLKGLGWSSPTELTSICFDYVPHDVEAALVAA